MKSMTGYGDASGESPRYRISVKARCVNHRFLDVVVRLPEERRGSESALRGLAADRLHRGRLELSVELQGLEQRRVRVELQDEALDELQRALDSLRDRGLSLEPPRLGDLLRIPELLQLQWSEAGWEEEDAALLQETAEAALDALVAEREREGRSIGEVLRRRLGELVGWVDSLEERRSLVTRAQLATLRARVLGLAEDLEIDDDRLAQEVAILVDRGDVTEEIDRLRSHVEGFEAGLDAEGPVGKRLDFLAQEILRELNTVGSKCRDGEMTSQVVEAKLICEQLREQVQNIE